MVQSEEQLRARLKKVRREVALRELAARIGLSHYVLHKFLRGEPVRATSVARIRRWAKHPGDDEVVQEVRQNLRRLLGRLGVRRALAVEGEMGRVIAAAFDEASEAVPRWVSRLGKKQL